MSQKLIAHNKDLKRLMDEGYEIEVKGGYLITHHIPYVNKSKDIKYGKLIVALNINNDAVTYQKHCSKHVINFMGEYPCNQDGSEISAIRLSSPNTPLFDDIIMNFSFSNKPQNDYDDYYEQMVRYIEIISTPAMSLDKNVTARTFRVINNEESSIFQYIDSNATRANIWNINNKLSNQKIAIIGLGGTGSYILDLIAKTPVSEINLYDDDIFCQHNAFRAPGAPIKAIFDGTQKKVNYFSSIYSNMHKGIKPHAEKITEDNVYQLFNMSFVFVCIDNDAARAMIVKELQQNNVPLIDVGMGVQTVDNFLIGSLRVTLVTPEKKDHVARRIPMGNNEDNEYATNIQIADLNALNANIAVIEWKKYSGFYHAIKRFHNFTYSTNDSNFVADEIFDT